MIGQRTDYGNRLASMYKVSFDTYDEMCDHLKALYHLFEKQGYITVKDLNGNDDTYMRVYGWRDRFPNVRFEGNTLVVLPQCQYLNEPLDSVDELHIRPEIIDILRSWGIDTMEKVRMNYWHIKDLSGIGKVYWGEIQNGYTQYQIRSGKGEIKP